MRPRFILDGEVAPRFFGEKLTLFSANGERPAATARALRHLHDYRNELQHHDHVGPESIRPAALILFDIALDLMVTVVPARCLSAATTTSTG